MRLVFVRHAEKGEIGEDPYLTKKGVKQAKHLAKRLGKERFDEFYCSNLNRSKQTADIISKKIGLKPKIEKSLNEFQIEVLKKPKSKWTKEEKSHYKSLIEFLKKITKNPKIGKDILISGHGITNRIILAFFMDFGLKNSIRFTQKEATINTIYWPKKYPNWRLDFWNDDNHVPKRLK